ncbi:MAG: hypothetical protein K5905_12040 [Roseibium sp.]|uniref:hypothetical protein n=1 Tax=Roseibium sp. TaxID=1936156 RepID=UPI0026052C2F|nr:hypothetical protein [Roseibium sp.]MCV0426197.1 hypothetical protein [Roseibium sp.]
MTFVADGIKDIVAIYTGSQSDSVEDDPLNHMDRVIFHSDLPYVEAVQVVSGEVATPAPVAAAWAYHATTNLFAHGLGYTPLVFPVAHDIYDYNGGFWSRVPANLAFPNWRQSPTNWYEGGAVSGNGQAGLTLIYANDTHVVATTYYNLAIGHVLRFDLKYTVYVTNVALSGEVNPPSGSGLIRMTADEVTIKGKFDSKDAHFSEFGSGDKVYFPMGPTLANESLAFRAFAITFDGQKLISSPYGTKGPIQRNNVASEGGGIDTDCVTARVTVS